MASNVVKFKLGPRQAIWNPCIDGFDGLNALGDNPVMEGEVNKDRDPRLFDAVFRALTCGTLVLADDNYQYRNIQKGADTASDKSKKKAEELPSEETRAIGILSSYNQDDLLALIEKSNDQNFLQILFEMESVAKNKTGSPRDKVKSALKQKIRELESPAL